MANNGQLYVCSHERKLAASVRTSQIQFPESVAKNNAHRLRNGDYWRKSKRIYLLQTLEDLCYRSSLVPALTLRPYRERGGGGMRESIALLSRIALRNAYYTYRSTHLLIKFPGNDGCEKQMIEE